MALHYAREGHRLILGGRNVERLAAVAAACTQAGAETHYQAGDVTARELMHQWIAGSDKRFPLDLVIANAGISGGTGGAVLEQALSEFAENFRYQFSGCSQHHRSDPAAHDRAWQRTDSFDQFARRFRCMARSSRLQHIKGSGAVLRRRVAHAPETDRCTNNRGLSRVYQNAAH